MSTESKTSGSSGGGPGVLGMLEKPWLLAWTLRVLIVTLFIDLALAMTSQKSLYLKGLTTALLADPGALLLALCAFGGYVCLLAPATFQVFKSVVWVHLPSTIPYRAPDHSSGYIRAHAVRKRAMMTENQFWLSQYAIHEEENSESREAAHTLALLLWTAFTLATAEVLIDVFSYRDGVLIVPALLRMQEDAVLRAFLGGAIGAAVVWAIVACLDRSIHDVAMYCPPYAEEVYQREQEAAKKQREFDERMLLERMAANARRQ